MNVGVATQMGVTVGESDRFIRRDDIDVHEIDGEAVLYDLVFNTTCRLNASAYFVWRVCDGRKSVHDVARDMVRHFDVTRDVANCDVLQAVGSLWESGLVERVEEGISA